MQARSGDEFGYFDEAYDDGKRPASKWGPFEPLPRTDLREADEQLWSRDGVPFISRHRWCEEKLEPLEPSKPRPEQPRPTPLKSAARTASPKISPRQPSPARSSGSRTSADSPRRKPWKYVIEPVAVSAESESDHDLEGASPRQVSYVRRRWESTRGPRQPLYREQEVKTPSPVRDRHLSQVNACTHSPVWLPYGNMAEIRQGHLSWGLPPTHRQQKRIDNATPDTFGLTLPDKVDSPVHGCTMSPVRVPYGTRASAAQGLYGPSLRPSSAGTSPRPSRPASARWSASDRPDSANLKHTPQPPFAESEPATPRSGRGRGRRKWYAASLRHAEESLRQADRTLQWIEQLQYNPGAAPTPRPQSARDGSSPRDARSRAGSEGGGRVEPLEVLLSNQWWKDGTWPTWAAPRTFGYGEAPRSKKKIASRSKATGRLLLRRPTKEEERGVVRGSRSRDHRTGPSSSSSSRPDAISRLPLHRLPPSPPPHSVGSLSMASTRPASQRTARSLDMPTSPALKPLTPKPPASPAASAELRTPPFPTPRPPESGRQSTERASTGPRGAKPFQRDLNLYLPTSARGNRQYDPIAGRFLQEGKAVPTDSSVALTPRPPPLSRLELDASISPAVSPVRAEARQGDDSNRRGSVPSSPLVSVPEGEVESNGLIGDCAHNADAIKPADQPTATGGADAKQHAQNSTTDETPRTREMGVQVGVTSVENEEARAVEEEVRTVQEDGGAVDVEESTDKAEVVEAAIVDDEKVGGAEDKEEAGERKETEESGGGEEEEVNDEGKAAISSGAEEMGDGKEEDGSERIVGKEEGEEQEDKGEEQVVIAGKETEEPAGSVNLAVTEAVDTEEQAHTGELEDAKHPDDATEPSQNARPLERKEDDVDVEYEEDFDEEEEKEEEAQEEERDGGGQVEDEVEELKEESGADMGGQEAENEGGDEIFEEREVIPSFVSLFLPASQQDEPTEKGMDVDGAQGAYEEDFEDEDDENESENENENQDRGGDGDEAILETDGEQKGGEDAEEPLVPVDRMNSMEVWPGEDVEWQEDEVTVRLRELVQQGVTALESGDDFEMQTLVDAARAWWADVGEEEAVRAVSNLREETEDEERREAVQKLVDLVVGEELESLPNVAEEVAVQKHPETSAVADAQPGQVMEGSEAQGCELDSELVRRPSGSSGEAVKSQALREGQGEGAGQGAFELDVSVHSAREWRSARRPSTLEALPEMEAEELVLHAAVESEEAMASTEEEEEGEKQEEEEKQEENPGEEETEKEVGGDEERMGELIAAGQELLQRLGDEAVAELLKALREGESALAAKLRAILCAGQEEGEEPVAALIRGGGELLGRLTTVEAQAVVRALCEGESVVAARLRRAVRALGEDAGESKD